MCECWATNPDSRPTFTEILQELKKFSQVSKRYKVFKIDVVPFEMDIIIEWVP